MRSPEYRVLIKDTSADTFCKQALTRPENFDIFVTMNLKGEAHLFDLEQSNDAGLYRMATSGQEHRTGS